MIKGLSITSIAYTIKSNLIFKKVVSLLDFKEIFDLVEKTSEEYISVWEDVCNIESPTNYKEGVDKVGKYFADLAEKHGWQVEFCKQDKVGDVVCITMNPEALEQPVTFSGHMDTVYPVGSFGDTPVTIKDGMIYGPGVADCKGGVVAGFLAMDVLQKLGFTSRPVRLLLQSDEENGSRLSQKATINYICEKAKDSVAFINLEQHTRGEACLQRKGIITFEFIVEGQESHSSRCAVSGANAIAEAAHKIIEIEKIKDDQGITCCCSVIKGGTVVNTVPGNCEFKVNVRFATAEQEAWIREYMQKIADTVYVEGCKTQLNISSYRTSMQHTVKNEQLLNRINECLEKAELPQLTASKRTGGSDAADVSAFGIPCVDSMGVVGGYIHSPKERAYIDSLAESAKRLVWVVKNI